MNRIISLKQTCDIFPSQWEGVLENGQQIYCRYRTGEFSVLIEPTKDVENYEVDHCSERDTIEEDRMSFAELKEILQELGITFKPNFFYESLEASYQRKF